jgi:hypothetical protein
VAVNAAPQPSAQDLAAIKAAAALYSVPLPLSLAVAAQESGISQTNASGGITTSKSGALGIYQLEPDTAAGLGVDPTNEAQNIIGGNEYLGQMLKLSGGDVATALQNYNAGPYATPAAKAASGASYVPAVEALATQYANGVTAAPPASGAANFATSSLAWLPFGIGTIAQSVTAGPQIGTSLEAAATNNLVSAVANQLTISGFTEKVVQFAVIVALLFGGFAIITRTA